MSMNTLLLSRLPIEQARCRELLSAYARMGSLGCMGAALVEEALLRLDASHRRETDARIAAEGLRSFLVSTEERARLGSASVIETEDARRLTLSAESTLLALQREQVSAWISLYRAVGGGWTRENNTPS